MFRVFRLGEITNKVHFCFKLVKLRPELLEIFIFFGIYQLTLLKKTKKKVNKMANLAQHQTEKFSLSSPSIKLKGHNFHCQLVSVKQETINCSDKCQV